MGPDRVTVRELWRYPVKSMVGERVGSAPVGERGIHADRLWAVREVERGATTTARRLPALLQCSARYAEEPPADAGPGNAAEAVITFPDGEELSTADPRAGALLTDLVGRKVELRPLPPETEKARFRAPLLTKSEIRHQFDLADDEELPDFSMFPVHKLAQLARNATPVGTYVDAYPLHLMTVGSLDAMRELTPEADFDVRRFRPNVVIDGSGEFDWCGGRLSGPDAELEPEIPTVRCSVPVREQPGLPAQPDVMRTIKRHSDRCLGVYANVARAGRLSEGDELTYGGRAQGGAARELGSRVRRSVVRASLKLMPR